MIVGDFEITNVDVYAQYGGQRVTSVPVGGSFEIHADYMIKNLNPSFWSQFWSTAMTVYEPVSGLIDADLFGDHYGGAWEDAHDAVNVVMTPESVNFFVQIFANQQHGAGRPPDDMCRAIYNNSDPSWVRLWYGVLVLETGAGAVFSGQIVSVTPKSVKAGAPLQITVGWQAHTTSLIEATNGWKVKAIVKIESVSKEALSSLLAGFDNAGNLSVNFGAMPASPVDGVIVLRCYKALLSSYYEDVDSASFQVLVTEEPPPPPPPPPPPGQASLYGQVKDSATQGVLVSVKVVAGGKTAYTNTSGNYTITGLTPGQVSVSFSKTGYQTLTRTFTLIEGSNLLNAQMVKGTAPPPPQTCSIDADCPEGYVCKNGVCVKKSALSDWALPALAIGAGLLLLLPGKKQGKKATKSR